MAKINVAYCSECGVEIVDQEAEVSKCLNPKCPKYNHAVLIKIITKEEQ